MCLRWVSRPALGIPQDAGNGVFGGRLSYFPTEYWTIIARSTPILWECQRS